MSAITRLGDCGLALSWATVSNVAPHGERQIAYLPNGSLHAAAIDRHH